jgi:hypothetical protein
MLSLELKKQGCLLLGEPGFGRCTEEELDQKTFPKVVRETAQPKMWLSNALFYRMHLEYSGMRSRTVNVSSKSKAHGDRMEEWDTPDLSQY